MVDIDGMMFGLFLAVLIIIAIILLMIFSTKKVIKNIKDKQVLNPLHVLAITFGLTFLFNNILNEIVIHIAIIIIGIIGNIYNYKNKENNRHFFLGIVVYSFMLLNSILGIIHYIEFYDLI